MKKLLLSLGGCLAIATASFSQTTLFQDDFESGSSQWTLNTGSGTNNWVANNVYLGFAGLIPDTPNQPGSFMNGPQSTYLHITNTSICAGLSVCNSNFDTGTASDQNAEIATSIDASSYTAVTVSFWWLCAGSVGTSYGTMEYSLNGGSTWTSTGTEYSGNTTWTQETISLPAWDNVAAFKVRFKWQNGGAGLDPAFSIDEVEIVGTSGGASNTITTDTNIQPGSWCEGQTITTQVNFTSTGTFNAGNVYTAELSDASGSFAAPLAIGTLASTANSGMIISIIPGSVPAGTGYRIRVVSDNPATVGSDNGVDLVINALPTVTLASFANVCDNGGNVTLTGGSPAGGSYSGVGVSGGLFDPQSGSSTITYTYTDGNGCVGSDDEPITVNAAPTVTLASFANVCDFDPFFTLTGGSPAGGTYSGPGVTGGVFDPAAAGVGTHTISYAFTDGNGCDGSAIETITVDVCMGINENNLENLVLYPNPVSESFQLISDYEIKSVQVLDMSGRIVKTFDEAQLAYDISSIPGGVYMVTIQTVDRIGQLRIVVE